MMRELFFNSFGDFKSAPFPGVFYWTSTESGTTGLYANVMQLLTRTDPPFLDFDYDDHSKDNSSSGGSYTYYVRAVRRF